MTSTEIPRVDDTDLDRDALLEVAEELDIDNTDALDDQELFEELGRRLQEAEEDDVAVEGEDAGGEEAGGQSPTASGTQSEASSSAGPGSIREELEGMKRDSIRDELRSLGLPVSGSKDELIQRLEAARVGASEADEQATDTAEQATETAEPAGEQATEAGEDAGEQAGEQGEEAAEAAGEQATDATETAEEATPDRQSARDEDEYRVEDDEREHISPILDLELGPLALDILGLDIHLNRIHAVLVANPEPKHALLGKLLSGVAKTTDKLGINGAVGKVTDGVEKVVDVLPTPTTGSDDEDEPDDEEDQPGILGRIRNRITGAGRSAKDAVESATDAAGNAKDAATDAATSGGKLQAAKEAKDAFQDTVDAGGSAKDAVTGQG